MSSFVLSTGTDYLLAAQYAHIVGLLRLSQAVQEGSFQHTGRVCLMSERRNISCQNTAALVLMVLIAIQGREQELGKYDLLGVPSQY